MRGRLVEQIRLLAGDTLPERLELEPTCEMSSHLSAGQPGVRWIDGYGLARSFGEQLRLAAPVQGDEPPDGFIHGVADGQRSVVAEDDGLAVAERLRDAFAFARLVHHAGKILEYRVVLKERAGVLRERVEQASERRPSLAIEGMGVRRGDNVGPRAMNLRVNGKRRRVHRMLAFNHFALVIHQN